MVRAFSWLLARRYLRTRWVNFVAIGGVTVAVWALIIVIAVFSGFISGIREDVRRSAPDLLVTDLPLLQSYAALQQTFEKDAAVAATSPRLRYFGEFHLLADYNIAQRSQQLDFSSADSPFLQLLGIDPAAESGTVPLGEWLARSQPDVRAPDPTKPLEVPAAAQWLGNQRAGLPTAARKKDQPLEPGILLGSPRVSRGFAEAIGNPLQLISAVVKANSKVVGIQKRFAFAGAFSTGLRLFDEAVAIVPIEALRTMLGQDAADDGSIDLITDVAVRVRPGNDLQQVAARLQRQVQAALPADAKACSVLDWEQQNTVFLGAVEVERAMMKIVLFAVMLIAAFLIYATLHMMVTQKVKDIGILAAMGGAPNSIGAIFVWCGLTDGLLGCLFGTTLGVLNTIYLNEVLGFLHLQLFPPNLYDVKTVPCELDVMWVVQVDAGAMLLALLVAWLPARKASRMHPVEALSYE